MLRQFEFYGTATGSWESMTSAAATRSLLSPQQYVPQVVNLVPGSGGPSTTLDPTNLYATLHAPRSGTASSVVGRVFSSVWFWLVAAGAGARRCGMDGRDRPIAPGERRYRRRPARGEPPPATAGGNGRRRDISVSRTGVPDTTIGRRLAAPLDAEADQTGESRPRGPRLPPERSIWTARAASQTPPVRSTPR